MLPDRNKKAPEAAATAPRAEIVALGKPTNLLSSKSASDASGLADGRRRKSRLSLRAAIDAMCKDCIYDPGNGSGGWREQVAGCCSSNCPLHLVRPLPVRATNPAGEHQDGATPVIGTTRYEQPHMGGKIGLNDDGAEERRVA